MPTSHAAAAPSTPCSPFSLLMDVNFFHLNKLMMLAAVFLFFCAVFLINHFIRKKPQPRLVAATIKLSVLGLAILVTQVVLVDFPGYERLIDPIQGLIVVFCLANLFIFFLINGYLQLRRRSTLPSFQRDLITLLVYLAFSIIALRLIFHIDISSIVTTTTVLTAAVAFAMQSTLSNILSGFSIQYEPNLRNTTWIYLKDKDITGEIINVGFRYTSLRTLENAIVMVPNSAIIQSVVTVLGNGNESGFAASLLRISLGYDLPPEKAKELLMRVLETEPLLAAEPAPLVRLMQFNDSSIDYQLKFFLTDFTLRDSVKDKLFSRIWYAVNREGYSFPFPHREIMRSSYRKPFALNGDEIRESLRQAEIFAILNDEELTILADQAELRVFGPGEIVVRQGEPGTSLFIVMRGKLLVEVDRLRVGEILDGSLFGEMSLLTGENRQATVMAETEVWLVEITHEELESVIRANPSIMEALSGILADRAEKNAVSRQLHQQKTIATDGKQEYLALLRKFFRL